MALYHAYKDEGRVFEANYYKNEAQQYLIESQQNLIRANKLWLLLSILGPAINLISCLIMALVIRLIHKIRNQVKVDSEALDSQKQVNTFVMVSHIGLTLAATVSEILFLFTKTTIETYRIEIAICFFYGMGDLVLSLLLWVIFDSDKTVTMVTDGDRVYEVKDII